MINKKRQELIIQNLRSISAEVRCMSIEQLLNLPAMTAEEKISHIEKVLNDNDETVRSQAAVAIAKLRGSADRIAPVATKPPAIPATPTCEDVPAVALPSIDSGSSSALPPIQETARPVIPSQPPPSVRPASLVLPKVSAPILPTALQSSSDTGPVSAPVAVPVVTPAARSVQTVELDEPIDPSLPDLKKMTDIASLLQHIKTLATQKPSGHVTQLLQLSRSMLEEVALTALQSLFNLKDRRVPSQIMGMLADEQYSSQRRFLMLKIIMDMEIDLDPAILEGILLKERDVIVKSGLVKVFARSSRESGVPTLIKCLQDEDPRVRANTVEVIEEQNISGCEQQIIQLLEDPENRVKVNAAKYLVKNGYQQAFMTLRAMLVSSEVWLRDSVIFALGEIGDQPSLTLLKAALKDPNQGIRLSVLKALARINNNTSRQVLKAACGDPDPVVAQVATSLFEKIKDTPMREEIKTITPRPVAPVPAATPPAAPVSPVVASPAVPKAPVPDLPAPGLPTVSDLADLPASPPPTLPAAPAAVPISRPMPSPGLAKTPVPRPTVPPPPRPVSAAGSSSVAIPPAMPGMPAFAKPRSAEIYAKLCSENIENQRAGARDIAFVMGDDQMILIKRAAELPDESIRIAAVKLLSRKKTPDALELLQKLTTDSNETVRSLAEKALQLQK